ncbi:unnamed protein product [Didymodactylos carnosus]|uniref:Flavin-containing monooxygenase n=1 Tax=Didymodactylos carnosus TaxID=1234261 RepID=A0A813Z9V9_9BILA|nr:unnamed protein product [Didymodactylos carnosus]CAF0896967.1 unnamed protein product [Didymodactylos carnosus]CAF3623712.1 unnamed protein product [Didymodactylos carnosus]CAF3680113.1 unnamed protein product [Didymodactylos carnosus]
MNKKLSIGIIGCGPSGLSALKELIAEGHQATVFEKSPYVGGIFKTVYQQGFMVSSNVITMFGDYVGKEGDEILKKPRMWSFVEYSKYLDDYAEHFSLKPYIHFETLVESVWKDAKSGKWNFRVSKMDENGQQQKQVFTFDQVAVCSGTHQLRSMPRFTGEAQYQGKIKHMQDVERFEDFAGKRVCIVGSGEAASDMALASAKFGEKSFLSIRKDHGWIVPRYLYGPNGPADLDTSRVRYSIPYQQGKLQSYLLIFYGLLVSYIKQLMSMGKKPLENEISRKRLLMNLEQINTSHFRNTYGTKNGGLVEALLKYKCQRKPAIKELKSTSIVFEDGTEEQVDEIICCTGFANKFAFFETDENRDDDIIKKVASDARVSHNLYKHCVHPLTGLELFFIGFVRPCFGAIPPLAEMQARWYALLCSGTLSLPDRQTMIQHSQTYVKYIEDQLTPYRTNRIVSLTDFVSYSDDIARLIHCRPNFVKMFFCEPKLWLKCQLGPMMNTHYRLCGPHAQQKEARHIIHTVKWIPNAFNFSQMLMLYTCSLLWFIGVKSCKPNTWYPIHEWS